MKPKKSEIDHEQLELGRPRLVSFLDMSRELVQLAHCIDWLKFEKKFENFFPSDRGRPALPVRLVVGLIYLKYVFNLSDEAVVERLLNDPYWQYFCGFEYFQHQLSIDASSLTRWRVRMSEDGAEELLQETLRVAHKVGLLKTSKCKKVIVDTTAQSKNISYPVDSKLINKAREKLVKIAREEGLEIRQSYKFKGKEEMMKSARYFHARQYKRSQASVKRQRNFLGRVIRDIDRKCCEPSDKLQAILSLSQRVYSQERLSKDKVYSLHESQVECLSKGKAHKRYEFGNKVSFAVTSKDNWVIGAKSFFGNPFDGKTLGSAAEQVERLTGEVVSQIFVDRGYRGKSYHPPGKEVFISGMRRLPPSVKRVLRRRSAIEPVIGHIKHDHRMDVNRLGGIEGDKINPILAASAFNMRKIMRSFFLFFFSRLREIRKRAYFMKIRGIYS